MQKTRIAIIGCGAVFQRFYLPALRLLGDLVQVDFALDVDEQAARSAASKFPGCKAGRSIDVMRGGDVSLAIISSPPAAHAEQSINLSGMGCHVLCEKPLAIHSADAERMIAAANSAERLLFVNHIRRFFPACRMLADLCRSRLGKLLSFDISEADSFNWPVQSQALFERDTAGGGVLMDVGTHVFDMLLWCLGEPQEVRYCDDAMGGVEATCRIEMDYATGATGKVFLSRDWGFENRWRFEFEHGVVNWNPQNLSEIEITPAGKDIRIFAEVCATSDARGRLTTYHACLSELLRNVLGAISGEENSAVAAEDGLRTLQLVERCYGNRKLIDLPWLSQAELDVARQGVNAC